MEAPLLGLHLTMFMQALEAGSWIRKTRNAIRWHLSTKAVDPYHSKQDGHPPTGLNRELSGKMLLDTCVAWYKFSLCMPRVHIWGNMRSKAWRLYARLTSKNPGPW